MPRCDLAKGRETVEPAACHTGLMTEMHRRRTRLIAGLGAALFAGILALAGALTLNEATPAPPVPEPSPAKQAPRDWQFAPSLSLRAIPTLWDATCAPRYRCPTADGC